LFPFSLPLALLSDLRLLLFLILSFFNDTLLDMRIKISVFLDALVFCFKLSMISLVVLGLGVLNKIFFDIH